MEKQITVDLLLGAINKEVRGVLEDFFKESGRKPILTPVYIDMKELCALLKVSKVTIHTWKKNGLIQFHKIGGKLLFDKQAILYKIKNEPNSFGRGRDYDYKTIGMEKRAKGGILSYARDITDDDPDFPKFD